MRTLFMVALFAVCLMSYQTKAGEWTYWETVDEFTDEITSVMVVVKAFDSKGLFAAYCSHDVKVQGVPMQGKVFQLAAIFEEGEKRIESPAEIKLRIDKGEVIKFVPFDSEGDRYKVIGQKGIELARMLVDAKQFVTSNGAEEVLKFVDLHNGSEIEKVIAYCGQ